MCVRYNNCVHCVMQQYERRDKIADKGIFVSLESFMSVCCVYVCVCLFLTYNS